MTARSEPASARHAHDPNPLPANLVDEADRSAARGRLCTRHTVTLTESDRQALLAGATEVMQYDPDEDTERFVMEAEIQSRKLSDMLYGELFRFRRFGNPTGGILIRGVPIADIPATPPDANGAVGLTPTASSTMTILGAILGEHVGYRSESRDRLIQAVLPVPHHWNGETSIAGATALECHTELAFSDFRPDYIGLLCLRPDHLRVAETTLTSVDTMLRRLDRRTLDVLRESRFKTTAGDAVCNSDIVVDDVSPAPILSGPVDRPHLRVDFTKTRATNPDARQALEALKAVAIARRLDFRLDASDLLFVDNQHALHGTTPLQPRYDGADRWLLSTFITKDLGGSETVRRGDGRIIELNSSRASGIRDARRARATGPCSATPARRYVWRQPPGTRGY